MEPKGGLYAVICQKTQARLLCTTEDLAQAQRDFLQHQRDNAAPDALLRADWETYGPEAFTFTVVERVPREEGESAQAYEKRLARLKEWRDMQAFGCC